MTGNGYVKHNYRCFNDYTRQLHVSAFTGYLQVIFKRRQPEDGQ